jgi:hypothetical protein
MNVVARIVVSLGIGIYFTTKMHELVSGYLDMFLALSILGL